MLQQRTASRLLFAAPWEYRNNNHGRRHKDRFTNAILVRAATDSNVFAVQSSISVVFPARAERLFLVALSIALNSGFHVVLDPNSEHMLFASCHAVLAVYYDVLRVCSKTDSGVGASTVPLKLFHRAQAQVQMTGRNAWLIGFFMISLQTGILPNHWFPY